jgi:required for meiotic nuclear division protein 1
VLKVQDIQLNCMMIADEIPLERVALHLGTCFTKKWNEVLVIENEQLESILKYQSKSYQKVLVYSYGAITFINFAVDEMRVIIDYVESIIQEIQNKDILRSVDVHRIWLSDNGLCKLFFSDDRFYYLSNDVFMLASHIVAQSIATSEIEKEIQQLLDNSENIILSIRKSKFIFNKKRRSELMSKVLRFQHDFIQSAQIFGAPLITYNDMELKEMYNKLSVYYELQDRFNIIRNKMDELKNINKRYSEMTHHLYEKRLLHLEVFLLAIFPLRHILGSQVKAGLFFLIQWIMDINVPDLLPLNIFLH